MSNFKFSISNAAREAERFGIQSALNLAQTAGFATGGLFGDPLKDSFNTLPSDETVVGALGNKVTSWLQILDQTFINNNNETEIIVGPRIDLVNFEISQQKIINETKIKEYEGTIKTFISASDYSITINGMVAHTLFVENRDLANRKYDFDTEATLASIFSAPIALKVYAPRLDAYGIDSIVIKSFRFLANTENKNMIKFTLDCVSDNTLEDLQNAKIN